MLKPNPAQNSRRRDSSPPVIGKLDRPVGTRGPCGECKKACSWQCGAKSGRTRIHRPGHRKGASVIVAEREENIARHLSGRGERAQRAG
jgi:hypothetical protein